MSNRLNGLDELAALAKCWNKLELSLSDSLNRFKASLAPDCAPFAIDWANMGRAVFPLLLMFRTLRRQLAPDDRPSRICGRMMFKAKHHFG
jgi:hypothetical protein